ncbi:MAG: TipAS antibiotic-recognition domain-containing protein [Anaerolineae bacterium]
MDEKDIYEGLDEQQERAYREEASARWGKERVDESYRRIAKYSKEEWKALQAEGKQWERRVAELIGRDPADPEVQARIAEHYGSINEHFYTCTSEIYRGLANLYIEDSRFAAHYDEIRPGMAQFMRAAMLVFCDELDKQA